MRIKKRFQKISNPEIVPITPNAETLIADKNTDHGKIQAEVEQLTELFQQHYKNRKTLMTEMLRWLKAYFKAEQVIYWKVSDDALSANQRFAVGLNARATGESISLAKPPYAQLVSHAEIIGEKNRLLLSMRYEGQVVGLLELKYTKSNDSSFGTQAFESYKSLSNLFTTYFVMSDQLHHQEKHLKRFEILHDLHLEFSSTMELHTLLQKVLLRSIELLEAEVGSIWLKSEAGDHIECHVAHGPTKDKVIGLKVKSGVGVIGWVVDNNKSKLVEDCSKDERFSSAVDEKIQFETRSMISAPLSIKGECLGAIQVINKKDKESLFHQSDLDFLCLIANESAMYIKNSQLFASENHAKELSALINISKEISSTLDLDAVLMSIVNLSSDIIDYDIAIISSYREESNKIQLRAVSGVEHINPDDPEIETMHALHQNIFDHGKEIKINKLAELEALRADLPELVTYMQEKALNSFWANVLVDEQGNLGVITMESVAENIVTESKKEILGILVSQSTVAMRNAVLYTTIPSSMVFAHLKDNLIRAILTIHHWSLRRKLIFGGSFALVFLALIFIQIPNDVPANVEVLPITHIHYAETQGRVARVHVRPGQNVEEGDLLIELDDSELRIELQQKETDRKKAIHEMIKLQLEDRIADYKIKESEVISLSYEIDRLRKKLEATEIRATHSGQVITENLRELQGVPVNFGDEIIKVSLLDKMYVQFEVPEAEAPFIRTGQLVKFKLFGYPLSSFEEGVSLLTVGAEGRQLTEQDPEKYFIATAEVSTNMLADAPLRPGLTGRGKIITDERSLGLVLFEAPLRFIMTEILF